MVVDTQKYKAVGILRGVSISEGEKGGKSWKRAALKVELTSGQNITCSSFNEADIKTANGLNGDNVEVTYMKSGDEGQYKNLEKGGIKQAGAAVVTEESVGQQQIKTPDVGTNNFNSAGKDTTKGKVDTSVTDFMSKNDWANKDKRSHRAMSIAYAKDLVVGGKLELGKMKLTAQMMFEFIWDGFVEEEPQVDPNAQASETTTEEIVM